MALEWAGEEEKNVEAAPQLDESGYIQIRDEQLKGFFKVPRLKISFDKGFGGGYYFWDETGKNTLITPPPPPTSPTITFKHGDVEKSITVSEADLKPRLKFKLHQKVDALIKQAYNK